MAQLLAESGGPDWSTLSLKVGWATWLWDDASGAPWHKLTNPLREDGK